MGEQQTGSHQKLQDGLVRYFHQFERQHCREPPHSFCRALVSRYPKLCLYTMYVKLTFFMIGTISMKRSTGLGLIVTTNPLMYLGRTRPQHQVFCPRASTSLAVFIATSTATLTVTSRAKTAHRSTTIAVPAKVGMPMVAMKPIYSSPGGEYYSMSTSPA